METKKTARKVSRVSLAWHNGGLEFLFDAPPYDAECRDRIAATCPGIEGSIDLLRAKGYSDPEIEQVFNSARAASRHGTYSMICDPVDLPRPIRVTLTVASRW